MTLRLSSQHLKHALSSDRAATATTRERNTLDPGEGAAGLALGGVAAGDAAEHAVDGGPADDSLGGLGVAFVVGGQPAVGGEPGQGSFHYPASGMDGET